jgi:cyclic-di-GMP phosphodiesterase TipF (flagellum assembly factor)
MLEPPRPDKPATPASKAFESPFQIPKRSPDVVLPPRSATKRAAPLQRQTAAPDPADVERAAQVREALAGGRHEIFLQPIVRLPSRRLSHYEAFSRLRDARNTVLDAPELFAAAERSGLAPELDRAGFEGAAILLRRLAAANRAIGAVLGVSPASLAEGGIMTRLADLAREDPVLAERLVLQMPQAAWAALPPTEADKVAALVEIGFRFCIDRLTHMRLDGRELARRGVRFVKLPVSLLLDPKAAATSPIHPNDLAGLLDRNGVTLVADQVEQEATVATLLEIGVKFAQGPIFGEPRPMRVEVPAEAEEPAPPAAPAPPPPKGGKSAKAGGSRPTGAKPRT